MTKPETYLRTRIKAALHAKRPGFWMVVHGSAMQRAGVPDIIGCYKGQFCALEVKLPGEGPTRLQRHTLEEIARAGGIAVAVTSVEEALDLIPA